MMPMMPSSAIPPTTPPATGAAASFGTEEGLLDADGPTVLLVAVAAVDVDVVSRLVDTIMPRPESVKVRDVVKVVGTLLWATLALLDTMAILERAVGRPLALVVGMASGMLVLAPEDVVEGEGVSCDCDVDGIAPAVLESRGTAPVGEDISVRLEVASCAPAMASVADETAAAWDDVRELGATAAAGAAPPFATSAALEMV